MNKGFLIVIAFLFGCDVTSAQPECIEGSCRADITRYFETSSLKDAATITDAGYEIVFEEEDFREGVGYFTLIAETSRPSLDYMYNNQYWVRASFKTDKEVIIRGEVVTVGKWTSRMDYRTVHNKLYGNLGLPPEDKLATRVVIGPIPKEMVERGEVLTVFMEVEYETGNIVKDEEKVVLKLF